MTPAQQHHRTTAPLAHVDVVVLDYLAALWAAADSLAPDLRDELMATVADYIALRRGATVDPLDDAEQILARLGPPEDLVAAAGRGRFPMHLRAPHVERSGTAREPAGHGDQVAVVLMIGGAAVLPVLGSLAGLVLISGSDRWSSSQKAAAWVLAVGGGLFGLACMLFFTLSHSPDFGMLVAYLSVVAGSAVAGLTLIPGLVARRR